MPSTMQTTQWLEQLNQFLTNLREAGPFIVLSFIVIATLLLVGLTMYLNYRLRSMEAKRDEARKQDVEQTNTRQDETLTKIVNVFGDAIKETKEDMAAAIFASNQTAKEVITVLKQTSEVSLSMLNLMKAQEDTAKTGIKDIIAAVKQVEEKVDSAIKGIAEIKAFYPLGDSPLAKVERELAEAIEALKDCARKATDENPVIVLPVETKPEDASALTPGAESEAAA